MKSFQSRGDQYIDDSIARVNEVFEVFYREYQVSYLGYWLDVRVIAPGVVNLQYGFSSARELEPSYGVDSKFEAPLTTVNEIETESMFELKTELLIVRISQSVLGVSFFYSKQGELLIEKEGGLDHEE
ncbi:MAG: alpha-glucosidase domain-containing protein, partial [Akkermansia sp.]